VYLDVLHEPVFVPLEGPVTPDASSEYRVHREVYKNTPHQAIVHAHPPAAIAASLVLNRVVPEDSEGLMFCPVIPVVDGAPGSDEVARTVSESLSGGRLVIARGHGTFAAGKTLDEAYQLTSLAEHSCRVLMYKTGFARYTRE
jgi:L-fuculose-phosphate aldolase